MTVLRIALALAVLVMAWLTFQAGQQLGLDTAGDFFFGDMAHPWRAQFNVDFSFHLLLVGAWMIWSASNRALGLLFGLLAVTGGALFTFAYLLFQTCRTDGNFKAVILGRHYQESDRL
jgi:hypothetical protein